jgi:hypothetical protein
VKSKVQVTRAYFIIVAPLGKFGSPRQLPTGASEGCLVNRDSHRRNSGQRSLAKLWAILIGGFLFPLNGQQPKQFGTRGDHGFG